MIHKIRHAMGAFVVFVVLTGGVLWLIGSPRLDRLARFVLGASGRMAADRYGHDGDGHVHEAPEEPVAPGAREKTDAANLDELQERVCEHKVRTIDCDSCRYELGVVKLRPDVAQALVTTGSVEERPIDTVLRATGQVHLDQNRVVEVLPPVGGRLTKVGAFLGQQVQRGDLLATIHSSEFGEAKAAFVEAHAELQLSQATLAREKGLYDKKISSEADYLEARREFQAAEAHHAAAEKKLHVLGLDGAQIAAALTEKSDERFAEIGVRAPRAGTVIAQNVSEGKRVEPAQSLFTVADLSNLWVWCDLYEKDLAALHAGLSARKGLDAIVRVGAFPDTSFTGTADLVGSAVDERTRTVKVRVQVKNPAGMLKPGMFARVEVLVPSENKALLAPRPSVLCDEGESFVFQHWKEDLWIRRNVKTGKDHGRHIEILEGVPNGATVIASGAFMLKSDVLRAKMGAGCAD